MTRYEPDAQSYQAGGGPEQSPRSSLTRLLTPIQAELSEIREGHRLTLESIRVPAVIGVLAEERSEASELLLWTEATDERTAADLADLAEPFEAGSGVDRDTRHVVLSGPRSAARAVAPARWHEGVLDAVLVDGPLDAGDVRAITAAQAADRSPLSAEIRAVIAARVTNDRVLEAEARVWGDLLCFVGESLRRYIAAVRGRPMSEIGVPEPRLVERVLDRTGYLQIRPIETEVFSTAIDVGIVTRRAPEPADTSLVYDIHANSWHGD